MVHLREAMERGVTLPRCIIVNMGTQTSADEFFAKYWPDALSIQDRKQVLYKAFGIRWGSFSQFIKPHVWRAYLEARSFGVGKAQGNTMRNPGAVLIHRDAVVWNQDFAHFGVLLDIDALAEGYRLTRVDSACTEDKPAK